MIFTLINRVETFNSAKFHELVLGIELYSASVVVNDVEPDRNARTELLLD